jgi:hypothetical protein
MDTISPFEKREELRRILSSKRFQKAEKKARFLEFVTEQTLLGSAEKLNEYLIGIDIYERGEDFNPQADPIVRVQAYQIRRLLTCYYENEGRDSTLRLELPAGHYIPQFSRVAGPGTSGETPAAVARSGRVGIDGRTIALGILACSSIVFAVLWIGTLGRKAAVQDVIKPTLAAGIEWFWQPFLPPAAPPLIVLPVHPLLRAAHGGDSAKTWERGRVIPKESFPEFRDTIHFRELDRFCFVPSITDFTAVGEAVGLVALLDLFHQADQAFQVRPSRLVDYETIKGRNTILLGGNQAWSGRIFVYPEDFHFYRGVVNNVHPRPGELPAYRPQFDPVTDSLVRDYALILMLPNERKQERVLLIYGIYTQGSQAAIEFVTTEKHLGELREALVALSPDLKTPPPYFQALIETTVENAVPGKARLVAVRILPTSG